MGTQKLPWAALSVPLFGNPFSADIFPNIQSKPPLAQLADISSCPVTCRLGKRDWHPPHYILLSGHCREQYFSCSLLLSRVSNPSSLSDSPHRPCSLDPSLPCNVISPCGWISSLDVFWFFSQRNLPCLPLADKVARSTEENTGTLERCSKTQKSREALGNIETTRKIDHAGQEQPNKINDSPPSSNNVERMQACSPLGPRTHVVVRNIPEAPTEIKSQRTGICCKDEQDFHQETGKEGSGEVSVILSGNNLYSLSVIKRNESYAGRIYSTNHALVWSTWPHPPVRQL